MTLTQCAGVRGCSWRLDDRAGGQRVRKMFRTLVEAQEFISQGNGKAVPAIEAQASQQAAALPVGTLFKKWLAHCDGLHKHSRRYQCVRGDYIRSVVNFFDAQGVTSVDQLTRSLFDQYAAARTAAGIHMSTVKKNYSILCAALNFGVSRELIARNPIAGFFRGVRIAEKIIEVPMPDALARVMAALPHSDARRLYWFLLASGCRISEAIALDVADVGADFIHFHRDCKGGYERHAPAPAFPFTLPASGLVFALHGHRWRRDVFGNLLWRACQRAGVARFSPHCLRHSHATYRLASGTPVYSIMAHCGWRSLAIVQRYVSVSCRYQNAGEFIPRWVGVFVALWLQFYAANGIIKSVLLGRRLGRFSCWSSVKYLPNSGLRHPYKVDVAGSNPAMPTTFFCIMNHLV